MCRVKKVTHVWMDQVRTKETTYRCHRSRRGELCDQAIVEDLGERFYQRPYHETDVASTDGTSSFIDVETQTNSSGSTNRRPSYRRRDLWDVLRLPFSGRSSREARNERLVRRWRYERPETTERIRYRYSSPYERTESPPRHSESPSFVLRIPSPPIVIERFPTERVGPPQQPASPVNIQYRRPRTATESNPQRRHSVAVHNSNPERVPIEMSGGLHSRDVPADRHVRFVQPDASEISDGGSCDIRGNDSWESQERQRLLQEVQDARQRAEDASRERREVEELADGVRSIVINRNPSLRQYVRPSTRLATARTLSPHRRQRTPPRIVQDGNRQLSNLGSRVIADARLRRRRDVSPGDDDRRRRERRSERRHSTSYWT
jgi:hypothetical protein